jgi:hypothetical protein
LQQRSAQASAEPFVFVRIESKTVWGGENGIALDPVFILISE